MHFRANDKHVYILCLLL